MKLNSKYIAWGALVGLGVMIISVISSTVSARIVAKEVAIQTINNQSGFTLPVGTSTGSVATNTTLGAMETSTIRLVPLSMLDASPRLVPESVLDRRSPVGILYARPKKASDMLLESEAVSRVVAMTSDGWFTAPYEAVKASVNLDWYIWHDTQVYKVEQKVLDSATGVVFIKVNASNLTAADFAQQLLNRTGIAVWLELGPMQFVPSSLSAMRASFYSEPRLSDELARRMVAMGQIEDNEVGSPIWDTNGSLVGITESGEGDKLKIIPGSAISGSLQSLISKQKIEHASLGVRTIPTSLVRSIDEELNLPERGAWVYSSNPNLPSVLQGGVAFTSGVKDGDVILRVDRDIIDESLDLGDIILQFVPGAKVTLRVLRDGEEIDIPVTLGTQVTSKEL
ncbi:MAG: PDZ domain-containing protein [Patescibacteria group bacterium]|nr:PDZ domain-containing protein [Patescibacteria group bacterium]